MDDTAGKLPLRSKLAFGLGGVGEAVALQSGQAYAMLFYNQVHGLGPGLTGMAIGASLILDGAVDPLIGSWSDRTRSKLGRRHPFMYLGPLPMALAFYLIFCPPAGLDKVGIFVWLLVTNIVMRLSMSIFHVPHLALGGEMSPDYTERSRVMSWYNFFLWLGGLGLQYTALSYFFAKTPQYKNGLLNPAAYQPFAVVFSIVIFVALMASTIFTQDRVKYLRPPTAEQTRFSFVGFFKDLFSAFTNRNLLWLLVPALFLSMSSGLRTGLTLYVNSFVFELSPNQMKLLLIGTAIGYMTTLLATAPLHHRFSKGPVMAGAAVVYGLSTATPLALRLMGLFFPNGHPLLVPAIICFDAINFGSYGIFGVSVLSAMADVADDNELKHGTRQQGMMYATRAFTAKVQQAVGAMLAGAALSYVAFPKKAAPGTVPHDILNHLSLIAGPGNLIPALIAALLYTQYKISRKSHDRTAALLAERRGRAKPGSEGADMPMTEDQVVAATTP